MMISTNRVKLPIIYVLLAGFIVVACGPADEPEVLKSGVDLEALDVNTRPQDDFYRFATGGWQDAHEIPAEYSSYTVYLETYLKVQDQLKAIVDEASISNSAHGSEAQKIGDYYNSWMEVDTLNALGLSPVAKDIAMIDAIKTRADLVAALADLHRKGVSIPLSFHVTLDSKDSTNHIPTFWQSGISMPNRDYYLDDDNEDYAKARDALRLYIAKSLEYMGVSQNNSKARAEALYALEYEIAKAQWPRVDTRDSDKTYNPYTPQELQELGDGFDWVSFLGDLGSETHEKIRIGQPSFAQSFTHLVATSDLGAWQDYLRFQLLDANAAHLSHELDILSFNFHGTALSGTTEQRERWQRGMSALNNVLGEALGKLYVEQNFPPEAKAKMEELVANVVETFDNELEVLNWMTPETRSSAMEKLSKFTAKIGYPDKWRDYSALEIIEGDHFGNVLRGRAFEYERRLKKLGNPPDPTEWFMSPQTVNAYYSPSMNEIVFPAARLQPPFFQLDADDAINYGAVGGVIGHEISHGFDDQGSKYDGDGNLRNWWTDEDRAAFDERTKVLIEQFNGFEVLPGLFVNGAQTLGENIGDLSGVTMAYKTYLVSLNDKEAPIIDGFTGEQRFFLGYATSRRGIFRRENLISRVASGVHAPLEFRVNGPYPNIDGFYDAYSVVEGDKMYLKPEERVKLW